MKIIVKKARPVTFRGNRGVFFGLFGDFLRGRDETVHETSGEAASDEVLVGQLRGLQQDVIGDFELADIVKQRTVGDRFQLFVASSYAGAFSSLLLPPLNAGLVWANKLAVDGSLEVVLGTPPKFASISLSGTNLVMTGTNGIPNGTYAVLTATNVALPLSNWVSITTNQFDSGGGFSFTNAVVPGIPQRFFRLEVR